jgi:hypothetical protein
MARERYQFVRADYKNALADYQNHWELIDDVLRKLCDDHPTHGDIAAVNAKVQIIGLSYGTGIQRLIARPGNGPGRTLYLVAEHLFHHHEEIDRLVETIRAIREPVTLQGLCSIVDVHACFVELLRQITRTRSNGPASQLIARSFASKYLHFHRRIVPIYDSVAATVLPSLMPRIRVTLPETPPQHADSVYYDYVLRFFALYSDIHSACLPASVKYVDAYLLWLASHREPRGANDLTV